MTYTNCYTNDTTRYTKEGFTLIEIMIAIVIVGIIAAISAPYFLGQVEKARVRATQATLRTLKSSLTQFRAEIGQYPETLKDLVRKPRDEKLARQWITPYLEGDVPEDSWGGRLIYKPTPGQEHPYELYSYGPEGKGAPKSEWIDVWKL